MTKLRIVLPTFLFALTTAFMTGCLTTKKYKDISYLAGDQKEGSPTLNVFTPKRTMGEKLPVLMFVYGGNWYSGKKELYWKLGRSFAKRGIVTVTPDYTLKSTGQL